MTLSTDARRDALATARWPDPLGIDVIEAARAVHDIVNANMAAAIRVVTVQRGIDPRGFTLVGFGGAGPMHAVRLAEMFGISSVAVPLAAGVASAVGLVGADLHVELVQTRVVDLAGADPAELEAAFAELADQARAELADEPGTAFEITRSADVRYRGQAYHLTLPFPTRRSSADDVAALATSFRARFEEAYGIALDLPTQIHNLRVHVVRVVEKFAPRSDTHRRSPAPVRRRPASASATSCSRRAEPRRVRHRAVRPDPARTRRPLRGARGDHRTGVDHRRPTAHVRRGRRLRHRAVDALSGSYRSSPARPGIVLPDS